MNNNWGIEVVEGEGVVENKDLLLVLLWSATQSTDNPSDVFIRRIWRATCEARPRDEGNPHGGCVHYSRASANTNVGCRFIEQPKLCMYTCF